MKKDFIKLSGIFIFLSVLIITCSENPFDTEKKSNPLDNTPPETYLFLFVVPDTIIVQDSLSTDTTITGIDTTASKQILHWWGDDRDGEVIGYYIQWDYQSEPIWTSSEYDTFYVPIRTAYDEFTFRVWAVDNDSLKDPTPAVQTFPVFNSMPEIEFKLNSNPPALPGNPNVTAYTFPTRTFMWDVSDPDGIETITKIYYSLDDTSTWIELPGNARSITLTNIVPGEHRFFVKAEDVASAQSNIISFPDPGDDLFPNTWIVKEPIGDVLLVSDYALDQNDPIVQNIYENMLQNIVGVGGYSVWQIGTTSTPPINPQNSLPYATADIKANLGYFDKVIWFSHLGRHNLSAAGLSITQYVSEGGKIFITNGNEAFPDTLWTFTDIDSVFRLNPGGRLLPGIDVLSSFTNTAIDSLLDLEIEILIGNRVSALIPGSNAEIVYRMEPDSTAPVSVPYPGSPAVGIRYEVGLGKSIYFSLPFHHCDGYSNMETVLDHILNTEFN
jgi:hypothetical protein